MNMVRAIDMKVNATGPLADIVGKKPQTRGQITKKLWAHVKQNDAQGSKGDTATYNSRAYKGGQVIFADTDELKALFGRKKKIAMVEMTVIANKYIE